MRNGCWTTRASTSPSRNAAAKPASSTSGVQVEDETELAEVYERLERAGRPVLEEKAATCCYAQSDKQWIADPQGVTWETFLTRGEATVYGRSAAIASLREVADAPCCGPSPAQLAVLAKPACGCGAKA